MRKNKGGQIHYASVERGNETQPNDEWSESWCGLELEPFYLSNRIEWVTCKNCLRRYHSLKSQTQINDNQGGDS